jgi:hypothetical protein
MVKTCSPLFHVETNLFADLSGAAWLHEQSASLPVLRMMESQRLKGFEG